MPLRANSTTSSSSRASAPVHRTAGAFVVPAGSMEADPSITFPEVGTEALIMLSNAFFLACKATMGRGSEWPVKTTKAVLDGREA